MMGGGQDFVENPNANYMNGRGFWAFYVLLIVHFHLTLLTLPIITFTVPWCWTATNVVHNLITFFVFHWTKSTPWLSPIEHGNTRRLTHWEQIDHGNQYTPTRTFLTIIPIILFMLTSFYTKYDSIHFVINFLSLVFVLVPKHHSFHKVRLFGINKY
eukprot:12342.XXX_882094_881550_1 [CDS] Oithona nana genome sequencing.